MYTEYFTDFTNFATDVYAASPPSPRTDLHPNAYTTSYSDPPTNCYTNSCATSNVILHSVFEPSPPPKQPTMSKEEIVSRRTPITNAFRKEALINCSPKDHISICTTVCANSLHKSRTLPCTSCAIKPCTSVFQCTSTRDCARSTINLRSTLPIISPAGSTYQLDLERHRNAGSGARAKLYDAGARLAPPHRQL